MTDLTKASAVASAGAPDFSRTDERRAVAVACGAHILHDGFTDTVYIMLPIWQGEFGLGYAALGLMKTMFSGALAGFQIPSGVLGERFGAPLVLALGTAVVGLGYCLAGLSTGHAMLIAALFLGGLGASTQHPLGSSLIAQAFAGTRSRKAIGTYNFTGDLGKMAMPAIASLLFLVLSWQHTLLLLGTVGVLASFAIFALAPRLRETHATEANAGPVADTSNTTHTSAFPLLVAVGMIDNATRAAFLTFLPFVLTAKGAGLQTIGTSLALVFAGGAAGKLVCTFIGVRIGTVATVWLTESATALGIVAILLLPLAPALVLLPVIGIALNGTSSVLYGSVPELVDAKKRTCAFSVFYTAAIGSGALAPTIYGLVGDAVGVPTAMVIAAGTVLITLPLTLMLRRAIRAVGAS
jgi:MFS transporter, FSR family, fosmidomycin resistance protein